MVNERRQHCTPTLKKARDDNRIDSAFLVGGRLFINNELQRSLLPPVMPPSEPFAGGCDITPSMMKSTQTCVVRAYKSDAASLSDLRKAYDSVLTLCDRAPDSIAYAYRYTDNDIIRENFDSGTEKGLGLKILKKMQNLMKM